MRYVSTVSGSRIENGWLPFCGCGVLASSPGDMSFLNNLSIQSKLILFLLLVALAAGIPLAWIGHQSGKNALENNIMSAMEGQRNIRRTQAQSM